MGSKYAKWLGGALGWTFGGPIGGLVGFSLGYLWQNATLEVNPSGDHSGRQTHQGDFAISLLVLASEIMRADDKVLKSELNYVKRFLIAQFGDDKSKELLRVLKDLLQRDIDLVPVCKQIVGFMSHAQRLQLVHFLIGIANADGELHKKEWELVKRIAGLLLISRKDLISLEAMYEIDADRYYRILEIEPNATADEIKTAYRKMAKKYHPDKLGDVGEDVLKAAEEKFRQVQEAYEKLNK
ncbi:TerB family tellurite resistance protein [Salibacteraceae bacterium]|jgi:DnaJ like chaperone protein|nr:TerB family tellurite resistance protein [Salibacteraceae bacterium]MDB9709376.1 TerB family tellurite resistance protein [Salibacteraceae bacterium]HAQ69793.1 molecular chaperone DnaJ [Flavobacteriales bacterium]